MCWECRGWHICRSCFEPKSTIDFSVYSKNGVRRIASRCRVCLSVRASRFETQAQILTAYRITEPEAAILADALPAYVAERIRVGRRRPRGQRPPPIARPAGMIFDESGLGFYDFVRLAEALIEIGKLVDRLAE